MALQGTLDTFSLPDVLRLLATTSKTGRLRIEGDRGQGSVWLSEGGVIDADAERAVDGTPTDEVVFELLRFDSGSFAFEAEAAAPDPSPPEPVEDVLRRATSLLNEWSELEAVVPSLQHHVTLAGDLSADEVTIDADRWRSVVAVAGGRTVGELATELGLTELGVSRAVRDLVELGVADVDGPERIPEPPRRREPAARDLAPRGIPSLEITGEHQRAGWLTADRTGEMPAITPDGMPPRPSPSPSLGNGQARASRDEPAPPPPAPTESPAKSGLSSRLGRNRSADTGAAAGGSRLSRNGAAAPGAAPAGGPADVGRPPLSGPGDPTTQPVPRASENGRGPRPEPTDRMRPPTSRSREGGRPPARPSDTGRTPRVDPTGPGETARGPRPGARDTGRTPRVDPTGPGEVARPPMVRRNDTGVPPTGPAPTTGPPTRRDPAAPTRRDPAAPRRTGPQGPPAGPNRPGRGSGLTGPSSPFDMGHLGPSPLPGDTGQIRPVNPSALPPDLHWAADDTGQHTGPISSPFSGLTSLGPTRPAPAPHDGEIAPHVAAMSPEARAAVQSTVGNSGGSGGRGTGPGEDSALRGRLISFLSTVR
ncbi:MAG TPA: DUF4388 domain-containing protein [Acidimicrobiales bacterium]|nr:DUF4388 domain-containing protein [Acidimicrobiales bacterium]